MPTLVEPDWLQPRALPGAPRPVPHRHRLERLLRTTSEDEPVTDRCAPMGHKEAPQHRRDWNYSPPSMALGLDQPSPRVPRVLDANDSRVEIDVGPIESPQLAGAQTRVHRCCP